MCSTIPALGELMCLIFMVGLLRTRLKYWSNLHAPSCPAAVTTAVLLLLSRLRTLFRRHRIPPLRAWRPSDRKAPTCRSSETPSPAYRSPLRELQPSCFSYSVRNPRQQIGKFFLALGQRFIQLLAGDTGR